MKSAPECAVDLLVSDEQAAFLSHYADELPDLFLVASVHIHTGRDTIDAIDTPWRRTQPESPVSMRPSALEKCPRCWKHQRAPQDTLCPRCTHVLHPTL